MEEDFPYWQGNSSTCGQQLIPVMLKPQDESPKIARYLTMKSSCPLRFNIHKMLLLVIFQFASGLAVPVAQNGNTGGGVFPGRVTWGFLGDYADPDLTNSHGNFYRNDDPSYLFLNNPNSIAENPNKNKGSRFANNAIFDTSKDQFSQTFKSSDRKPLFTFDNNFIPNRRPNSKSVPENENDVDRVLSDIIRIVPSRDRGNFNIDTDSTDSRSQTSFNTDNQFNNQNAVDSNGGGWTVIKPRIIGTASRIPRIREETTRSPAEIQENVAVTSKPARFPLLATAFPLSTSTTRQPLFNFVRERTLDEGVQKSSQDRGSVFPGSVFPAPTRLQGARGQGRGSGSTVHSSVTTLISMITMIIISKLLLI